MTNKICRVKNDDASAWQESYTEVHSFILKKSFDSYIALSTFLSCRATLKNRIHTVYRHKSGLERLQYLTWEFFDKRGTFWEEGLIIGFLKGRARVGRALQEDIFW